MFSENSNSSTPQKGVILWLMSGCVLVGMMVLLGGITRLTQSGLSIVDWRPVTGILPPLSESDWQTEFLKYQQSPEFLLKNAHYTLTEFKSIFWWEYLHRLLGRIAGIVFIIPFFYFLIQKKLSRELLRKLILVFCIGAFQGFLGWYMVKSGLMKSPHVSHYRLAMHLSIAFTLFGILVWIALDEIKTNKPQTFMPAFFRKAGFIFLVLLGIQIVLGAFTAGLKAGLGYNTWPKMNDEWIAKSIFYNFNRDGFLSLFENSASVQFLHRTNGILLLCLGIFIGIKGITLPSGHIMKPIVFLLPSILFIQFLLGVFTLLYAVPVSLGVFHQLTALALFTVTVLYLHACRKVKSVREVNLTSA